MKTKKIENLQSLSLKDFALLNILYLSSNKESPSLSIPKIIERTSTFHKTIGAITQSYVRNFIMTLLERKYVYEYRGDKPYDITYKLTESGLSYYNDIQKIIVDLASGSNQELNYELSSIIVINNLDKLEFANKIQLIRNLINNLRDDGFDIEWSINKKKQ